MLSIFGPGARAVREQLEINRRDAGHAAGVLMKSAGKPTSVYALSGKLYLSSSGWLLMDVPSAIVHGLYAALDVPGIELPPARGAAYRAHVSVMDKKEVEQVGADAIRERGKLFSWQLGPIMTVEPSGWPEMAAVYFAQVSSPGLKKLRQSYGLPPLLKGHEFHCTLAVKRRGILGNNGISKAAVVQVGGDHGDAPARPAVAAAYEERPEVHGLPGAGLRAGVQHPVPGGDPRKSAALVAAAIFAPAGRQHLHGADAGLRIGPGPSDADGLLKLVAMAGTPARRLLPDG